jgi:hypothetical protein
MRALDRAAAVRSAVASRSFSAEVRSVALAGGARPLPVPALPDPGAADLRRVRTLPSSLRSPVAGLYAAVHQAAVILGPLPADEVGREIRGLMQGLQTLPSRAMRDAIVLPPPSPFPTSPVRMFGKTSLLGPVSLGAATDRAIARDPQAAMLIAAALDRYLPSLQQAAAAIPSRAGAAATGCDMLDQSPDLCVGSSADNTYTGDELVLIDLGGNNTFDNAAGAAPFLPSPSSTSYVPVSLNVSLGGNDTYVAPDLPLVDSTNPKALAASIRIGQGTGIVGGLGVLVDTGGNDSYSTSTGTVPDPNADGTMNSALAAGQGAGVMGIGMLFDGQGDDVYSVRGPRTQKHVLTAVFGQGVGQAGDGGGCWLGTGGCSQGALFDVGGGNDTYVLDAGSFMETSPVPVYVAGAAIGQGAGATTTGLLFDDGGTDTFSAVQRAATQDHSTGAGPFQGPLVAIEAQGYGTEGTGMLLEGPGTHDYRIDAQVRGLGASTWSLAGQAWATFGATAVLQDLGSGNSYLLREMMTDRHTFAVQDDCGCTTASQLVDAYSGESGFVPVMALGQGSANQGVSVLDNHGDGTYQATAIESIRSTLADGLTSPAGAASLDVTGHQPARLIAQGATFPVVLLFPIPSYSLLLNRSGHATYRAINADTVKATATSANGPTPHVVGVSPWQFDYAAMQGAAVWNGAAVPGGGEAALVDLGGPGDTFDTLQAHAVATKPNTGGNLAAGAFWDPVQGAGNGAVFVAAGAGPSIVGSPANGICPTSPSPRGAGTWIDCSTYTAPGTDPDHATYDFLGGLDNPGNAVGSAPQATAAAPGLDIVSSPTAAVDGTTVPVSVRLLEPSGAPIAKGRLHVDLQVGIPIASGTLVQWVNISQTEAITSPGGIANAKLPVALQRLVGLTAMPAGWQTQLLVTFDGGPGLTPRHQSAPISVSFPAP